ncbi:MAG: trigger factor [Mycoplasmataceae bacterium]|nr:trigger factor [Mycoplasmataceae bacterium]
MTKKELNKKTSELLITVIADKKVWKTEQEKAFDKEAKLVEVKGFRKGSVPKDMARKHISGAKLIEVAITPMLDLMVKEASGEIDKDIMILDSPTYKVEKVSDAELEITFIYPIYPEIKLPDYKKTGVEYKVEKINDEKVDEEIKKLLSGHIKTESKEGAIVNGDNVIFDFDGSVDGVQFDGGKAEKYELEIGSGQFIPGFEEQMVGLKAKDEKEVKVTFPKDYHSEDLKGKEAIFKVLVHEVKIKVTPKLDDTFVKTLGVEKVGKVEELKKYLKKLFVEQEVQAARSKFIRDVFAKLKEETTIAIPAALIVKETANQEKQFEEEIKQQGLTIQKYIEMTGMKPELLISQFKAQAEEKLLESLLFAEISKLEKIELTDEDYAKEYVNLAKVYNQTEEAVKGMITKEQMQIPMTNDRVIDAIIKATKK